MPKLLWMSPYSLHDISSGASIHCRYILESVNPLPLYLRELAASRV